MTTNRLTELRCPNCNGTVTVAPDTRLTTCSYCGSMLTVQHDDTDFPTTTLASIRSDVGLLARQTARERLGQRIDAAMEKQAQLYIRYQNARAPYEVKNRNGGNGSWVWLTAIIISLLTETWWLAIIGGLGLLIMAVVILDARKSLDALEQQYSGENAAIHAEIEQLIARQKKIVAEIDEITDRF